MDGVRHRQGFGAGAGGDGEGASNGASRSCSNKITAQACPPLLHAATQHAWAHGQYLHVHWHAVALGFALHATAWNAEHAFRGEEGLYP